MSKSLMVRMTHRPEKKSFVGSLGHNLEILKLIYPFNAKAQNQTPSRVLHRSLQADSKKHYEMSKVQE